MGGTSLGGGTRCGQAVGPCGVEGWVCPGADQGAQRAERAGGLDGGSAREAQSKWTTYTGPSRRADDL
jgi:hypothetical protein